MEKFSFRGGSPAAFSAPEEIHSFPDSASHYQQTESGMDFPIIRWLLPLLPDSRTGFQQSAHGIRELLPSEPQLPTADIK
jgi:hypothetical protein